MDDVDMLDGGACQWGVTLLTLFPEIFPGPFGHSLAGRALRQRVWQLNTVNIRSFATDKHKTVDDRSFGGGSGMIMRPDVIGMAIEHVMELTKSKKVIYMSPRGKFFNQEKAEELIKSSNIIILCGRYEGIDERIIDEYDVEEISIGDFILSGGEIAAIPLIDACVRLLPGVIENEQALMEESFGGKGQHTGLLEYPQYTRPSQWKDRAVPEALLSGNHALIADWRLKKAQEVTKERRPDLWQAYQQSDIEY